MTCPLCGASMVHARSDYWGWFLVCERYYILNEQAKSSCVGYRRLKVAEEKGG